MTEQSTLITSMFNATTLAVVTRTLPGCGTVDLSIDDGHQEPGTVATVYLVDLCSALCASFSLGMIAPNGAEVGNEFSVTRRRNLRQTPGTAGCYMLTTVDSGPVDLLIEAMVDGPLIAVSGRGNPVIHPVNTRALLILAVGSRAICIDPVHLIDTLVAGGLVNRYTDNQKVFTRHLSEPGAPFEVWPNGRAVPAHLYETAV